MPYLIPYFYLPKDRHQGGGGKCFDDYAHRIMNDQNVNPNIREQVKVFYNDDHSRTAKKPLMFNFLNERSNTFNRKFPEQTALSDRVEFGGDIVVKKSEKKEEFKDEKPSRVSPEPETIPKPTRRVTVKAPKSQPSARPDRPNGSTKPVPSKQPATPVPNKQPPKPSRPEPQPVPSVQKKSTPRPPTALPRPAQPNVSSQAIPTPSTATPRQSQAPAGPPVPVDPPVKPTTLVSKKGLQLFGPRGGSSLLGKRPAPDPPNPYLVEASKQRKLGPSSPGPSMLDASTTDPFHQTRCSTPASNISTSSKVQDPRQRAKSGSVVKPPLPPIQPPKIAPSVNHDLLITMDPMPEFQFSDDEENNEGNYSSSNAAFSSDESVSGDSPRVSTTPPPAPSPTEMIVQNYIENGAQPIVPPLERRLSIEERVAAISSFTPVIPPPVVRSNSTSSDRERKTSTDRDRKVSEKDRIKKIDDKDVKVIKDIHNTALADPRKSRKDAISLNKPELQRLKVSDDYWSLFNNYAALHINNDDRHKFSVDIQKFKTIKDADVSGTYRKTLARLQDELDKLEKINWPDVQYPQFKKDYCRQRINSNVKSVRSAIDNVQSAYGLVHKLMLVQGAFLTPKQLLRDIREHIEQAREEYGLVN